MRRREFITLVGGAVAWPVAARAQQAAMPVIGVLSAAPAVIGEKRMPAFYRGLSERGYSEGQNVTVSHLDAEGENDRLAALAAEFVRRQVNVIVTPNSAPAALSERRPTRFYVSGPEKVRGLDAIVRCADVADVTTNALFCSARPPTQSSRASADAKR